MTRRKLSSGMQAALQRTQAVHQEIQSLQRERAPVQYLHVDELRPSRFQARMDFTGLDSLARDIEQHGVLVPLLARPVEGGAELMAGERRWRASRLAAATVPERAYVPVMVREATDEEARLFGLRENLEREDLNGYEVASAALELAALGLTTTAQDVRARLTRRSGVEPEVEAALQDALTVLGRDLTRLSFTKHYLPLLDLPDALREAIRRGASYNAVRLLRRATPDQQAEWLPRIESGEWGVRDVEAALQGARAGATVPPSGAAPTLAEETRRVFRLASPRRIERLDAGRQKRLQKLLREVEALLQNGGE
ncbi:ParB/RepB/Spo0J family partition protein [Deinococcus aestuarii]|uniref:ParB/RepB/Spo0J family partition protein n=1 Tax=Deinococcus aestuarii TaxID=2774531 RepID=UPI001C0B22D7|nr:ParB/RepB/Spo0J family partition protein [Deinococcus aestuarii]